MADGVSIVAVSIAAFLTAINQISIIITAKQLWMQQQQLPIPELPLQEKGSFEISGICFTPDAFRTEGRGIFSADE